MVQLAVLIQFFEQFAPQKLAEEWDNVGLLIGDPDAQIEHVLTCLTLTPDVAAEAVNKHVGLIVTHHPVLFRPIQRLTTESSEGAMLLGLIQSGIAVYAPHTRYDNAAEGINVQIAERLHLENLQPLKPMVADSPADSELALGAGRFGQLAVSCRLSELLSIIKSQFGAETLGLVGDASRSVQTIGIACGSAANFLTAARKAGCDLFITGEARFHDCLAARTMGLAMILLGHYVSERFAMEQLAVILGESFPPLTVEPSDSESDPLDWV